MLGLLAHQVSRDAARFRQANHQVHIVVEGDLRRCGGQHISRMRLTTLLLGGISSVLERLLMVVYLLRLRDRLRQQDGGLNWALANAGLVRKNEAIAAVKHGHRDVLGVEARRILIVLLQHRLHDLALQVDGHCR